MGWFGFNGGSALNADFLAGSASLRRKPLPLPLASCGCWSSGFTRASRPLWVWRRVSLLGSWLSRLRAVTSTSVVVCASVLPLQVVCYLAVALKNVLGYDDSLDAFGVHGVGGFVGAVLTGVFCSQLVQSASADGMLAFTAHRAKYEKIKPTGVDKDGKDIDSAPVAEAKKKAEEAKKKFDDKTTEMTPKLEELAKAETAAQEAFDKGEIGKRDEFADKWTDAKDATKKAKEDLSKLEAELGVADDAVAKLAAEITQLKGIIDTQDANKKTSMSQLMIQIKAAGISVIFAFVGSLVLCVLTQAITLGKFKTNEKGEADGLDRTEHGEVGFDFSGATESVTVATTEPRAAAAPKGNGNGRFELQLNGTEAGELMKVWTELCQPTDGPVDPNFLAVYPYVTTVRGTTFRFRGGDQAEVAKRLSALLTKHLGKSVKAVKVT